MWSPLVANTLEEGIPESIWAENIFLAIRMNMEESISTEIILAADITSRVNIWVENICTGNIPESIWMESICMVNIRESIWAENISTVNTWVANTWMNRPTGNLWEVNIRMCIVRNTSTVMTMVRQAQRIRPCVLHVVITNHTLLIIIRPLSPQPTPLPPRRYMCRHIRRRIGKVLLLWYHRTFRQRIHKGKGVSW